VSDLGFDVTKTAELDSLTDEIVTSNEIEGVTLNAEAVRSSVARQLGIDYSAPSIDAHQVDGAVEMMLDATTCFDTPLSNERLFSWHAALFPTGYSGLYKIITGAYRTAEMQIVSGGHGKELVHYQAPVPGEVEPMMERFLTWFNVDHTLDPVLKAGIAHLWFVSVHPFDDGNGRITRALTELQLARSDGSPRRFYTMSAQILASRSTYYDMLEQAQKGTSDITLWLEWFLLTLRNALSSSESKLEKVLARAVFWQQMEGIPLNDRQHKMLALLLGDFEGKLTTVKWAKMTKVSQDTATRDINDLLKKGILVKGSPGGRSTAYTIA
jgi:Fic family protein